MIWFSLIKLCPARHIDGMPRHNLCGKSKFFVIFYFFSSSIFTFFLPPLLNTFFVSMMIFMMLSMLIWLKRNLDKANFSKAFIPGRKLTQEWFRQGTTIVIQHLGRGYIIFVFSFNWNSFELLCNTLRFYYVSKCWILFVWFY